MAQRRRAGFGVADPSGIEVGGERSTVSGSATLLPM
jgi:hypothetical protein